MFNNKLLTRRKFLKDSLQIGGGMLIASTPVASFAKLNPAHEMTFLNTHTGEELRINYSCKGCTATTQRKLDYFLRDFRTEEVHTIDRQLIDIIFAIQNRTGSNGTIEIISGFRSTKTNKLLRAKSTGVASKSLHMKGMALDFRLTDLNTRKLRDVAITLKRGGVGYYSKSNFVHIDTGRIRTW